MKDKNEKNNSGPKEQSSKSIIKLDTSRGMVFVTDGNGSLKKFYLLE